MPRISKNKPRTETAQQRRNKKAAALLRKWMEEKSDYDERAWPALERELNAQRMLQRVH